MKIKKRVFNFIKDGKIIDTYEVTKRRDFELFLELKYYAEKRGVKVLEE